MEVLHKSNFGNFQIVVSDLEKSAVSIGTVHLFLQGTWKIQNIHPISIMYLDQSKKLAYFSVKMSVTCSQTYNHKESLSWCIKTAHLVQRHNIIRKVAYLKVRKLCKS